ncbi:MAG: hypothetical protein IJB86_02655 [Clostridia bacterium]|nr:hypothetical protein [Clostridia bacterium]
MQKKTKKVLVAVLTVLFTLSVSYFALVGPTTAWYYQEKNDSYSFTFGDFDVEQENREEISTAIPLRASTRFADAGEILFDEVIHAVKVDAENTGGMTAQVRVKVTEGEGNPEGLKWFIYDTAADSEIPEVTGSEIAIKGEYKTAIETMLSEYSVSPIDYNSLTSADVEAEYEAYNQTAVTALDSHNSNKIVFDSGEKRVIYVVFWAEYGEVRSALDVDTPVTLGNYAVDIEFEAGPYIPDYQEIIIRNESSSNANVMLYLNGSSTPYTGAYYYTTGENEQQMNAVNGLIGTTNDGKEYKIRLEVGTPFKLRIANSGASIKFSVDDTKGTVSGVTNMVVTGTVTNYGINIGIVNV